MVDLDAALTRSSLVTLVPLPRRRLSPAQKLCRSPSSLLFAHHLSTQAGKPPLQTLRSPRCIPSSNSELRPCLSRARLGDDARPNDVKPPPKRPRRPESSRHRFQMTAPSAESVSSASALSSLSEAAAMTPEPSLSASRDSVPASRSFILRNGRPYLDDPKLPYPLPSDLAELHRQSLRTLLLCELFGAPVCSPALSKKPPRRVLEVGCGSGFWSLMCHRYYKSRGHSDISFTGIDVVPLWSGSGATHAPGLDKDMKWTFIKHDISRLPWPLGDKFDLIMVKDMSLAVVESQLQYRIIGKYLRFLKPGGTIEIWDSDHVIRMLRPHVHESTPDGDTNKQEAVSSLGAYVMSANTPLSASSNPFLASYNAWLERALEARHLSSVPCSLIGPSMLQESDALDDIQSRRLAIPLGEVRWEREPDGSSSDGTMGKEATNQMALSDDQSALRATALLTVVQQVQALEPILREASGKSQDEWDVWMGKMMSNLISDGGASWGECLEVGVWWARKKVSLEEEVDESLDDLDG